MRQFIRLSSCSIVVLILQICVGDGSANANFDGYFPATVSGAASSVTSAVRSPSDELPTSMWPEGVEVNSAITTPREFFGFDIGERHLSHAQVASYVRLLAKESPRISIEQYAATHGGRPLLLLTITSKDNRQRLGEIQKAHRQLTKANSDRVDLGKLPAVINMGYGVHGDEASATNCAPLVAFYLAAAQGDEINAWLEQCVILLDPSLNPDGFNRFANWVNRYRGRVANPDSQDAEHNQMWPAGRVNYYWFDLNRDWLPLVHPESRGRMTWYHKWKPNVVLDFHEMGTNSTFFFQPGIPQRTNPLTPQRNQQLTREFGGFHAKALDQRGSLYFTQERFDDFYMGKGSTYPDLHGSVGILFEQASSRGVVQGNQDGLLRFHETVANQFTASLSSLRATTAMRAKLNNYKKTFYLNALKQAKSQPVKAYLFQSEGNWSRLLEFAAVLKRHDIQSYFMPADFTYGDEEFSADFSLVVPTAQAEFRFLQSLLMRRTNFKENVFYDVSSWTLPLAYGLTQRTLKQDFDLDELVPFKIQKLTSAGDFEMSDEHLGYLVDFKDDIGPWVLNKLLLANVKVRVAKKPFTVKNGNGGLDDFSYGTLAVISKNQQTRHEAIDRVLKEAVKRGAKVLPVKTGLSVAGPDLGSANFEVLKVPKVALLVGKGTSFYSAGSVWHLLDTQIGMPVTLLKSDGFSRSRLDSYSTLVLAGGSLSSEHWSKIESFAENGGTVLALGSLAVTVQKELGTGTALPSPPTVTPVIQKQFDTAATERALKLISGAIFKTTVDPSHPLLFGFQDKSLAVFRNHARFLEPSKNPYCNPVIYDSESPLMAGYCSDENVERFKGAASVVVQPKGKGRFILMADDPNFRGFWKATSRVFLNGLFFGDLVDP
ncbi:M14 family metallopeptidase [Mariniblastus sp.]|nr:M14 family metallopeptidase [Mariniblastus sp.]